MPIGDMLRRLFADDESQTFQGSKPGQVGMSAAQRDVDIFAERLNRILWQRRSILSGNIHLVGLQKIRVRLGAEWPRISDRAQDVAQKTIQRFCKPDDIFTRYDELSFLIIFSDLSVEQAQLRCHEIGEEIGRRLLGDNFATEATEVSTGVFETDGSLIFNAVSKDELLRRLLPPDATAAPAAAMADASATERGETSSEGLPDFSFAQVDRTKALASMDVMYRPMWNLRHKAIANYFVTAGAVNVFGDQLWDTNLRREFGDILSPAEFDIYVARRALRDMAANVAQGQKMLLCWPVHFETIAGRIGRQAYIGLCRDIPDAVRQLLIFELDGLPEGTPQSRLLDVLSVLRPFCRGQIVRVPWAFRQFSQMTGTGLNGIGFDLAAAPRGDAERIRILEDFAAAASKIGFRCYAHGLNSRAQALAAMAAGYEWINGEAVEHMVALPGPMMRFNLDDLYRGI
jgi:hypothetical protein